MLREGGASRLFLSLNNPVLKLRPTFLCTPALQIHFTHFNEHGEIFNNRKWLILAACCLDRLQLQVGVIYIYIYTAGQVLFR